MSANRWSLLVLLALCTWGGWWFLSRAFGLARDTSYESHARAYIRRVDEAQKGFLKENPGQGFACKLDDLRHAGLASPSENKYNFELHCDRRERPPEMEYLVVAYPADKRVKGVWGFQVFCSDQTGEIWGELSRENMRDNLSESEKAGLYDFEGICRRNRHASRQ
jgi:hypothetical protein